MTKNKNIIFQFIFWILLFLITNRIMGIREDDNLQVLIVSMIIVFSFALISYLNVCFLVPKLLNKKKYIIYIVIITAIAFVVPVSFVEFDLISISCKGGTVVKILQNPLRPRVMVIFFITAMFLFVSAIIRLSVDFAKKEKQKIHIEKERLLIETQYLRSQMNPHFFLNALNNLNYINRLLPNESEKYINTLAEMMRYVIYDCKKNRVDIEKEIKYIANYIYFQKLKDNDIVVNYQEDIKDLTLQIEPMLLMPFVENAFKYGVFEESIKYPILIDIRQSKNNVCFRCQNSINYEIHKNTDPSYSNLGIKNVKNRLELIYPNAHDLKIEKYHSSFLVELTLTLI